MLDGQIRRMAGSPSNLINPSALAKITEINASKFASYSKAVVSGDKVPTMRSSVLIDRVDSIIIDREYSAALCSQIVALATVRRIETRDLETIYDAIVESMPLNGLTSDHQEWFTTNRNAFIELLEMKSVRLVAKALHLTTDYTDLFVSSNIVTDVRPVFDTDRDVVIGGIVTQNLRLHFISGNGSSGEQEMSLALDSDDIDKLIRELEKAKKKSRAAAQYLQEGLGDNFFVAGEDTYGFG